MTKVNRNDPCPCGSGKKYKKCCGLKELEAKKPRLGGARLLPQGLGVSKNPSVNLAQKVFKVLTAPSGAAKETPKEDAPAQQQTESQKTYGSLEELIGIEGAPKEVTPPSTETT